MHSVVSMIIRNAQQLQRHQYYLPVRLFHYSSQQQCQRHIFRISPEMTFCTANPILRYDSQKNIGRILLLQQQQQQHHQYQQYRTKMKLIDFDQFEPEVMAEKEARITREIETGIPKQTYRRKKELKKEKLLAEERVKYTFRHDIWEETIRNLLNEETYPVGFTNTYESNVIASWCQQISNVLQQTLSLNAAMSLELALKLLDRLFQEQEAHNPNSPTGVEVLMSTDVSSSAIESTLKSWKFSLLYPPYYELMTEKDVHRAQERVQYYGKFLAKHDESMLAQLSKLLDVDRIIHTKTKTTDRILWGHIPHTIHPNATDDNAKVYWGFVDAAESEIDFDGKYFDKMESKPEQDGYYDFDEKSKKNDDTVNDAAAAADEEKPKRRKR